MQSTRVCSISDLQPSLQNKLKGWIHSDNPIQYCVEGIYTDSSFTLRNAIVLTQNGILYAAEEPGGGGHSYNKKYAEIERIEEITSPDSRHHYINISLTRVSGPPDSIRFDFETSEKVFSFANILRNLSGR